MFPGIRASVSRFKFQRINNIWIEDVHRSRYSQRIGDQDKGE
jgi:hypothetical protein